MEDYITFKAEPTKDQAFLQFSTDWGKGSSQIPQGKFMDHNQRY